MNSKIFTLTTLFLFFIIKISAQNANAPIDNIVDINFSVTDGINGQYFAITSEGEHFLPSGSDFIFRINLDNSSEEDTVSYFGIQYTLTKLLADGTPGQVLRGITAPVLIPPVKKKKSRVDIRLEEYPFPIPEKHILLNIKYEVKMNLVKYHSREDYLDEETLNYDILPAINFDLNASLYTTAFENSLNSFSISAYPNPSTNFVTFDYTSEAIEHAILQQRLLDVTIFNDKGIKVSQHSLTSASAKANSISYNLDTSHLPKGRYYFQLLHGGKTQVKTILKK